MSPEQLFNADVAFLKHVVTVNAEIFVCAHEQKVMGDVLQGTVNTIDGRVLQWICQLMYWRSQVGRLPGADFIYDLAAYCSVRSQSLFLLGAGHDANTHAIESLRRLFPSLQVDGFSPPYVSDIADQQWNNEIIRQISARHPQHLVVCFGPVKQEYWIKRHRDLLYELGVRCAYGLGGTIDFVSGAKRRAPKWVQQIGVEWLYRFLYEPQARLARTMKMFKMPFYAAFTRRDVQLQ